MELFVFRKMVHNEVNVESLQHIGIDREPRELSKSLFIFDPNIRFHSKKTIAKGGL